MEHTDPIARNAASTNPEKDMYQNPIKRKKTNGNSMKIKNEKQLLTSHFKGGTI